MHLDYFYCFVVKPPTNAKIKPIMKKTGPKKKPPIIASSGKNTQPIIPKTMRISPDANITDLTFSSFVFAKSKLIAIIVNYSIDGAIYIHLAFFNGKECSSIQRGARAGFRENGQWWVIIL